MVAAKFAYSFQGVKDILVLTELGKYPGWGVKAKRIKNSKNKSFNKLRLWQKQVGAMQAPCQEVRTGL